MYFSLVLFVFIIFNTFLSCSVEYEKLSIYEFKITTLTGALYFSIYIDSAKLSDEIKDHLTSDEHVKVTLHAYHKLCDHLLKLEPHVQGKIWVADQCSYGIAHLIPEVGILIHSAVTVLLVKFHPLLLTKF